MTGPPVRRPLRARAAAPLELRVRFGGHRYTLVSFATFSSANEDERSADGQTGARTSRAGFRSCSIDWIGSPPLADLAARFRLPLADAADPTPRDVSDEKRSPAHRGGRGQRTGHRFCSRDVLYPHRVLARFDHRAIDRG